MNDHATRADFPTLYLPVQATLRSYLRALVGADTHADDVLQEVALTLWQEFEHYDPSRPFLNWAMGVARNRAARWRRRQSRERLRFRPEVEAALAEDFAALEDELEGQRRALRSCLQRLGDQARHLLRERYELGRSLGEIADLQRRSLNAVSKQLGRVRETLGRCTRRLLQETP